MKKVMKILYDELEKDLIELMHEATPMNLNSLVNTIRDCEDVKTVKIRRFYSKGDIHADDRKSIYNNSYLAVIGLSFEYKNERIEGILSAFLIT